MQTCHTLLAVIIFCCLAKRVFSNLWPSGQYGLPMPKTGCPTANGFQWATGYIYQDLEDKASQTAVSPGAHLSGFVSNDVLQYFCIKENTFSHLSRPPWPAGQYCIYRKGRTCPTGMLSGSLLFDNENANGTNKNSHNGTLPDGVYNQDTKVFFCCRTTGSYNVAIELPVDKPFYLIAYRPYCQQVLNAVHTMEYMVYDTEDDNNHDQKTFPYPYGAELREPRIHYCYYQACLWTLTALKGSFTSPYYPLNYNDKAFCTWHIIVPRNYTISLTFKDFSTEAHCCHCDYVKVWETHSNGSTVLMQTFCDDNKPDPSKPLNSSSNNVTIVFRSDYNINVKGFEAKYEAFPITAITSTTGIPTVNTTIETRTTITKQQTTKAVTTQTNSSSTPAFESEIKQNITTPLPFGTRRSSAHADNVTSLITKKTTTTAPVTTEIITDKESVHGASNESATTGNVSVIAGVIASLIVIGGAAAGVVLCYCKKCRLKRNHETDRNKLAITFTSTDKNEIGISNVSFPDMYQGSVCEDKTEQERYSEIEKTHNILYENGTGLITSEKDAVTKENDNPLYASSAESEDKRDNPMYDEFVIKKESDNPIYESDTSEKGSENLMYDGFVKEGDAPIYESMGDTLQRTINAVDLQLYERMV